MMTEKKTYTLFASDLISTADKLNPGLADIKILSTGQILEAWSILYIRPDSKRIYLKISEFPKKRYNRFEILNMDSKDLSSNKEFV
jgi:hypothetical protein